MKAAKRFEGLAKAIILGLIVATFVFAPLGVVNVSADDGGSSGQPGQPPPDTLLHAPAIDPGVGDGTLLTTKYLTVLRFVVL